jgi:hypothetical protein
MNSKNFLMLGAFAGLTVLAACKSSSDTKPGAGGAGGAGETASAATGAGGAGGGPACDMAAKCPDVITNGAIPCAGTDAEKYYSAFIMCVCDPANCGNSDCKASCAGMGDPDMACTTCAQGTVAGACKAEFDGCSNH